jgi:predicted XRE-type DNA-binding protein
MPAQSSRETDVESSNQPDYSAVDLPSKDPTDFSYVERRAELLQRVKEAGEPSVLNQTELADTFGVTQQQISKDLDRLATHIRDRMIDRDRRAFVVENVVRRSIRGLLDDEEYRKAAQTAMDYDDWIHDFHDAAEFERRLDELEAQQERGDGGL